MERGLNPLENLVNFITGDSILFGFLQAFLFLVTILSLFNEFLGRSKRGSNAEKLSRGTTAVNPAATSIYLALVIFFAVVCTTAEEIHGHTIFWLGLDLSLLTYLFFFNKWFGKKLSL